MEREIWRIYLEGGLAVRRPDGSLVKFATRKTGAIIAMLALERGGPLARGEIAAALWPGAPRAMQLANLRQALHHLRCDLGDVAPFQNDRDSCWLLTELVAIAEPGRQVLPEMVEAWFDSYRSVDDVEETVRQEADSAESLLTLLGWAARYRPREGLSLVKDFPDLAEMAEPTRLSSLLDRCIKTVRPDDHLFGWGLALKAMVKGIQGNVEDAIGTLNKALEHSFKEGDTELSVFTTFYLSACLVLAGRTGELRTLLSRTRSVRPRGISQVRQRHGRGLCLMHLGDFAEGLAELRFAKDLIDAQAAPYEHAYVLANLALFESTNGTVESAESALSDLDQSVGPGCVRLMLTGILARWAQCPSSSMTV